jgi:hypothetical protein
VAVAAQTSDIVPDPFLFPDYGDTLARAFQREAELFFDSIIREDRQAPSCSPPTTPSSTSDSRSTTALPT